MRFWKITPPTAIPIAWPNARKKTTIATALVRLSFVADGKDELKRAYTDSLRVIWAFMACVAGVGLVLSVFVKKYGLNRALSGGQGVKKEA